MRRIFFILIFLLALTVRLFKIDTIPSEWYGDISNVHEYVTQILKGDWPFYFFQSPGPFYHYLIVPIVWLFQGHGYETYKGASIIISILGLVATYLFIREISSRTLALITTLVASLSLWFVIWSRLGNSQIVIPVLVSFLSYFLVRYLKRGKFWDIFFTCLVASLGWYTYPQTFLFPVAFLVYLVFFLVITKKLKSSRWHLFSTILFLFIFALPFINIVKRQPDNFGSKGYVGEKVLPVISMEKGELIKKIINNIKKTALMLHVKGDISFRVNVSSHPQIDWISGLLFFAGIAYFFFLKRRIWLSLILWMLVVLPLASISPAIPEVEIPNSARTIAIVPFVFLLVGGGILLVYKGLRGLKISAPLASFVVSCVFAYSVLINIRLYFTTYAYGLPDRNLGPGRIIGQAVDKLGREVGVYFSSCCWGEWGEPEPKGVAYVLRVKREINYHKLIEGCNEIDHYPALIIANPYTENELEKFRKCSSQYKTSSIITEGGQLISRFILLE